MVYAMLGLYIVYCAGADAWRSGLPLSIGPKLSTLHLKMETEFSLRNTVRFKQKQDMDNVQKHNNCRNKIVLKEFV
jgi:hypothetical protein